MRATLSIKSSQTFFFFLECSTVGMFVRVTVERENEHSPNESAHEQRVRLRDEGTDVCLVHCPVQNAPNAGAGAASYSIRERSSTFAPIPCRITTVVTRRKSLR